MLSEKMLPLSATAAISHENVSSLRNKKKEKEDEKYR